MSIRIERERDQRPIINLDIRGIDGVWRQFDFLVDTGADITLLSRENADKLKLPIFGARQVVIAGILEQSDLFFVHNVDMRIAHCCFVGQVAVPLKDGPMLLGRDVLLSAFEVTFDQNEIVLTPRFSFCNCG